MAKKDNRKIIQLQIEVKNNGKKLASLKGVNRVHEKDILELKIIEME